jgi:signal transduction histidine kinase
VCTALTLRFDEDAVVLTASTPPSGRPAAAGGAGRGLAGLRERATAAGGEATWRLSSDGFTVEVRVPR